MDILIPETCCAHNKWNKIASDIKLVFHSSTIAMMHGPINIRFTKNVFCFSLKRLFETSLILRITERDMIKKTYIGLHYSTRYSCPIAMKLEFSWQFFENYSNIKFPDYPSGGSRVVPCGRTDKKKRTVFLRNFANVPTKRLSFGPPYLPGRPYLSTTRAFQRSVPHFFTFC